MNSWILQGNPKRFDVDSYLGRQTNIVWTVGNTNMQRSIQKNDTVFIWRSDGFVRGSGGIVAKGLIVDTPKPLQDDAKELWTSKEGLGTSNRVKILLMDVRLTTEEGMLLRANLEDDLELSNLWILKWRASILYKVSPEHALSIEKLWKAFKK